MVCNDRPLVGWAQCFLLWTLVLWVPGEPRAGDFISAVSNGPSSQLILIPGPAMPTRLGKATVAAEWVQDNTFMGSASEDELLVLDAETTRLSLRGEWVGERCVGVGGAVHMLAISGGHFDRTIDRWHKFFAMPDGNRDDSPMHQVNLAYLNEPEGEGLARLNSAERGVADAVLALHYSPRCGRSTPSQRWRIGSSVPLGQATQWLGSEAVDVFADWESPQWSVGSRLGLRARLGLSWPGPRSEVFPLPLPRRRIGFGSVVMNAALGPYWTLAAQINLREPLYRSELRELGMHGVQGLLALRRRGAHGVWEIGFSEDLIVDTYPDIAAWLSWRHHF